MCGRFALKSPARILADLFDFVPSMTLGPRYNIAPTQPVLVVRRVEKAVAREGVMLRWGLVPRWADDPSIGSRMINARSETLAEKPSFREAFKRRRCLIPADGFYEWQAQGKKGKQPYFIHRRDGAPLAFAGLWESWRGQGPDLLETCTIITRPAAGVVATLHDRMPVILEPGQWDAWLAPETRPEELVAMFNLPIPPPEADTLEVYPVSKRVNSGAVDEPGCME